MMAPFPAIVIPLSAGRVLSFPWNDPVQRLAARIASPPKDIDFVTANARLLQTVSELIEAAVWRAFPSAIAQPGEEPSGTMLRTLTFSDAHKLAYVLAELHREVPIGEALRYYQTEVRPKLQAFAKIDHLPLASIVANPDLMISAA